VIEELVASAMGGRLPSPWPVLAVQRYQRRMNGRPVRRK
jgi:hypothetical protein